MAAKFYPFPVGLYAVIGFSRLTVETYLSLWHIIYEEFLVPLLLLLLLLYHVIFATERRKSLFKNTQKA